MAETMPNPFYTSSPLGDALRNLSNTIMSGPTEAQRILQAEQALKAQNQRIGTQGLSDVFRQYGTPAFDPNAAVANAVQAGQDPAHVGSGIRVLAANKFGVDDPRTSAAFVGAGGAFGSSPVGARETNAIKLYEFNNTPQVYGTNAGPVIGTRQTAIGQPAVEPLSNVQGNAARVALNSPGGIASQPAAVQRFIHADAKDQITHNYVAPGGVVIQTRDGLTEAGSGKPLPQGGYIASPQGDITGLGIRPNVQGKLQEQDIALQRLKGVGDYAQSFITPQTVGIPGVVKSLTQNAAETVANVSKGLGYNGPQEALANMKQRAIAGGMDPGLVGQLFSFDPRVPKIETAYHMLTLSAAEALAGGMGRASDRDMRVVSHMLGSPESLFATPQSLKSKMDAINDLIGIQRGTINQNLNRQPGANPPAATAAPGAGAAPPPSPAPGAPQTVEKWDYVNGQLQRVQ